MEPNVPLLRKVVEWVEEQDRLPKSERVWNQIFWCGTTYCIAGKLALDDGWQVLDSQSNTVHKGGLAAWPDDIAKNLLGLAIGDASQLFDPDNTAADIRRIAEELAGERL